MKNVGSRLALRFSRSIEQTGGRLSYVHSVTGTKISSASLPTPAPAQQTQNRSARRDESTLQLRAAFQVQLADVSVTTEGKVFADGSPGLRNV